jgi:hypothetical protein
MSVTPDAALRGVLPVVISGGRPRLPQRPTWRLLRDLHGVTADPVWVVREDRAPDYEPDGHEIVTYSKADCEAFAEAHWMGHVPYAPGAFLGCFTEREWACRTAAARGCWAVLQLDDNIRRLDCFTAYGASGKVVRDRGGLALFADLLAAVTLSTNSVMTGAKLQSVNPAKEAFVFARAGFPYSLFLERVDYDRAPYIGPIEEDILHAYEIGASAAASTAAIVQPITYMKEHHDQKTGMRANYDGTRSAGLQRVAPEMAKLSIHKSHSNGAGGPRVFHAMVPGAIRTPLAVLDQPLYTAARDTARDMAREVMTAMRDAVPARLARRAARAGRG